MAQVVGPGGSNSKSGATTGKSMGPCGPSGGTDITTKRGYESKRTTGLRTDYKLGGSANNSKA